MNDPSSPSSSFLSSFPSSSHYHSSLPFLPGARPCEPLDIPSPSKGRRTRSSHSDWKLCIFIFKRRPIHWQGHRVTGGGEERGGALQGPAWLSTNGSSPWQQALLRLSLLGWESALRGPSQAPFPSWPGSRLLTESLVGGGGKPRAPGFPLLVRVQITHSLPLSVGSTPRAPREEAS